MSDSIIVKYKLAHSRISSIRALKSSWSLVRRIIMGDITINQHYVPRFLLDGFRINPSDEELAKVNVLRIRHTKFLFNQSVKEVFSQNYFYDKDNAIESFIESHIETPSSKLIKQFRSGVFDNLNVDCKCLTKFFCCQLMRTQETLNETLRYSEEHSYHIAEDLLEQNGMEYEGDVRDLFSLEFSDREAKRRVISQAVLDSVLISKGMEDLKFHILVNKTSEDFIVSDHPVIKYNWFYKDLAELGVTVLMNKGVQLFLPLSNRIYLCAYDSSVYKYGAKNSNVSEIINKEDAYFLNTLQIRNANDIITVSSSIDEGQFLKLVAQYHNKRINIVKNIGLGSVNNSKPDERTTLGAVYYNQRNLSDKPTFFKVLKKAKIHQTSLVVRNPYLVDGVNMLFAHRDQQVQRKLEP